MLRNLYGQASNSDRAKTSSDIQYSAFYATKTFEENVKKRQDIDISYFSYLFFSAIANLCCCLKNCCNRTEWFRKRGIKQRKFKMALSRLSQEQDI